MNGRIKKLVVDKGFGFIIGDDKKEYFFHRSSLKNSRIENLKEGIEVTFEDNEGSRGLRADDIMV